MITILEFATCVLCICHTKCLGDLQRQELAAVYEFDLCGRPGDDYNFGVCNAKWLDDGAALEGVLNCHQSHFSSDDATDLFSWLSLVLRRKKAKSFRRNGYRVGAITERIVDASAKNE